MRANSTYHEEGEHLVHLGGDARATGGDEEREGGGEGGARDGLGHADRSHDIMDQETPFYDSTRG